MDDRDTDYIQKIAAETAPKCTKVFTDKQRAEIIESAIRQALAEAQEWRDMESAPIQQPVLFKAQNGMQWVAQVYRGLLPVCPVTRQPAVGWQPLPRTEP